MEYMQIGKKKKQTAMNNFSNVSEKKERQCISSWVTGSPDTGKELGVLFKEGTRINNYNFSKMMKSHQRLFFLNCKYHRSVAQSFYILVHL